ncbi:Hsp33 family molecular chaperone HslO, partial [Enterococcus faecalis]|uniref:Hsp33 family molecular chaperone HslO n=1 Tax=Enterococcus faecalis TaxID=1351 RepID=UPI001560B08F
SLEQSHLNCTGIFSKISTSSSPNKRYKTCSGVSPFSSNCEIGEDFTYFMAVSEQVPSAIGLGVLVDTDESVKAAGGFMIQV